MHAAEVRIQNYKVHEKTTVKLGEFGCIIGANNAGKSSILSAIQFGVGDTKITPEEFRDKNSPVVVEIEFHGITERDLQRLEESHRQRIRNIIRGESLTLTRIQRPSESPEMKYIARLPLEEQYTIEVLGEAIKGKRRGAAIYDAATAICPALGKHVDRENATKEAIVSALTDIVASLPEGDVRYAPADLPSGISASIKNFLPEVVYIEAVKDAASEAKTSGSAVFGKILGLIFSGIAADLADLEDKFSEVYQRLNGPSERGEREGLQRIGVVENMESVIRDHLGSTFPGAGLRIHVPTPTVQNLVSTAEILVDDGHESVLETKGDGLKRAVIFSLVRAYSALRSAGVKDGNVPSRPVLLLFEEPELYLHPWAQRQLMAALTAISRTDQVLVTTHSPSFFGPGMSGFTKLVKGSGGVNVYSIDLNVGAREQYQLIHFENNDAAFFAEHVVLVEGDSDAVVFPHIAKILNPNWDANERNIAFVKTGGKGSVGRYREFFESFGVCVSVITDLDSIVDGYSIIKKSNRANDAHSQLMEVCKNTLLAHQDVSNKWIKKQVGRGDVKSSWLAARSAFECWSMSREEHHAREIVENMERLFARETNGPVLELISSAEGDEIARLRGQVLEALAEDGVYVLRHGDLEEYTGTLASSDKVKSALDFCAACGSLDAFMELQKERHPNAIVEFDKIFTRIFFHDRVKNA